MNYTDFNQPQPDLTLPKGWQREMLINTVEQAASLIGLSPAHMRTLRYIMQTTRPIDFVTAGNEPVCYLRQADIAVDLGADERTIRRHEDKFVKLGLVRKCTMANGARRGFKGCGIFFGPAIEALPQLLQIIAQAKERRETHRRLYNERSTLLRYFKRTILPLLHENPDCTTLRSLYANFTNWPSYKVLSNWSISALSTHIDEAEKLCRSLEEYSEKQSQMSGRPDSNDRSFIQDTKEDSNLSCNAENEDNTEVAPDRTQSANHKWLRNLRPTTIKALCTPELRHLIDISSGDPDHYTVRNLEMACYRRAVQLGISQSAWVSANTAMGPQLTWLCLIAIDQKSTSRHPDVRNPGGNTVMERRKQYGLNFGIVIARKSLIGARQKSIFTAAREDREFTDDEIGALTKTFAEMAEYAEPSVKLMDGEQKALECCAHGLTQKQAASKLNVSAITINRNLNNNWGVYGTYT